VICLAARKERALITRARDIYNATTAERGEEIHKTARARMLPLRRDIERRFSPDLDTRVMWALFEFSIPKSGIMRALYRGSAPAADSAVVERSFAIARWKQFKSEFHSNANEILSSGICLEIAPNNFYTSGMAQLFHRRMTFYRIY